MPTAQALDSARPAGPVVQVGGFWRRSLAAAVDALCLSPVLLIAGWFAFRMAGISVAGGPALRAEVVLELLLWGGLPVYAVLVLAIGLTQLYAFLFLAVAGHTPGLRLLRLRVINVYGERPEWWRVVLRCCGLLLGMGLLGLGLIWIGVDREKRGLHDWLAGTYVVRRTT